MDDLIARLNAAEYGTNDLDAAVLHAMGWTHGVRDYSRGRDGQPYQLDHWIDADGRMWTGTHYPSSPYALTSKIDDALKAVPSGFTRAVDATAPECGVDVTLYGEAGYETVGTHKLEPLATVIAAMKARAAGYR